MPKIVGSIRLQSRLAAANSRPISLCSQRERRPAVEQAAVEFENVLQIEVAALRHVVEQAREKRLRLTAACARRPASSFFHRPFGRSFTLSAKKQKTSWLTKCATASRSGLRCCNESEIVWNLSAASLVSLSRVRPERSSSGLWKTARRWARVDRVGELFKLEFVFRRHFVGPARLDAEDVRVAGDVQRRIFERGGIASQLFKRLIKIALLLLIFPGEVALLPDVGPAFAAAGLGRRPSRK